MLVLFLFLSIIFVSFPQIEVVKAQDTIYIREDGSVEGTNNIQRNGDLYTFTGDISNERILVEKDNIVIDGAGYTLIGAEGRGIVLSERKNVTVKNVKLEMEGGYGILLSTASNCTISGNTIIGDAYNIKLDNSFDNTVEGNTVTNASRGILIYRSNNNNIIGNIVTDSVVGIELHDCYNNVLRNNQMRNNRSNFSVRQYPTYRYDNDVDTSNTVDGKPIIYWVNQQDKTVPSDAAYVALINCTNIKVQNLNKLGILLVHTKDSTIKNNTQINIMLIHSSNNSITENKVQNCSTGIQLEESSHNTISRNYIAYNDRGIRPLYSSVNNVISENEIAENEYGIDDLQDPAGSNQILRNNITANKFGIDLLSSNNIISENNITGNDLGILSSGSNRLIGNKVMNNGDGIYLRSSNNILRNNHMENNSRNFTPSSGGFVNDVDMSNTVENKPIVYWVNQKDKIVPSDVGYVALVNCKNITVKNLTLSYNVEGILVAFTTDSMITQNILKNMSYGIRFYGSSNNQIIANNITNNNYGIYFHGYRFLGTYDPSPNNIIYHNNFVDNQEAVYDIAESSSPWFEADPAVNIWDNGTTGNYWSNYNGTDANGDGIGDTPYIINENNQDNYPLMNPVDITTIPEFPSWTLLLIMLVVVLAVVVIYRCNLKKQNQGRF
jgi:parallel beta-helix repeat protein